VKCRKVIVELSSYLNGELDAGTYESIERHLEHCDDCRLVVDTTRKTVQIYCKSEPLALPEDVRDRLRKALESRLRRRTV